MKSAVSEYWKEACLRVLRVDKDFETCGAAEPIRLLTSKTWIDIAPRTELEHWKEGDLAIEVESDAKIAESLKCGGGGGGGGGTA